MTEKIIMWSVCFGCGILFLSIGLYAARAKKPMWFWSGLEVDPYQITDVVQYNKENGAMWEKYSLWYFAAGVAEIWNTLVAAGFLLLGCTIGLYLLIRAYNKIYKKYSLY